MIEPIKLAMIIVVKAPFQPKNAPIAPNSLISPPPIPSFLSRIRANQARI